MARLPRLNLPDVPQHVIQRGKNHGDCFFAEQDYTVYLDQLNHYAKKYAVAVHAYVLMRNHVHLLLTSTTQNGVSQLMQALGQSYVRYINTTHARTGALWDGRFKSTLVDSDTYFLTVSRYIELNPVSAAMVEHPADYSWSSYHSNALGKSTELLTAHARYQQLGQTPGARQAAYRALFDERISPETIAAINDATNKSWALGSDRFKAQVELKSGRRAFPSHRGGDRRSKEYREASAS